MRVGGDLAALPANGEVVEKGGVERRKGRGGFWAQALPTLISKQRPLTSGETLNPTVSTNQRLPRPDRICQTSATFQTCRLDYRDRDTDRYDRSSVILNSSKY